MRQTKNNIKIFFLALTIIFFISGNLFSQIYRWYPVSAGTTQKLNAVTSNLIVGDNGTVLKRTSDTTNLWIPVSAGITANLFCHIGNAGMNHIGGNNGTIVKISTIEPFTFQLINTGVNKNIYGFNLLTQSNPSFFRYIAVGEDGLLLHSTNAGGVNWIQQPAFTSQDLNCITVFELNRKKAWIGSENGRIFLTTNTGVNWNEVNTGFSGNIKKVIFIDTLKGYAVGTNGLAIKTTNGGYNWTSMNVPSSASFNDISYSTSNSNIILICGDGGVIFRTINEGNSWEHQTTNTSQNLNGILSISNSDAFAVGSNGTILHRKVDPLYNPLRVFNPNNINTFIRTSGIFNQNTNMQNQAGFEWPAGSGKFLLFTSGLTIAAKVNNELRMAAGSYKGEYLPGYVNSSGQFETNDGMKIYRVSKTDVPSSNHDWMNWGLMVPFGAPYVDVNGNFQYDPLIDTPGVKNANQTIFCVMTDANSSSHTSGEGFGGGTTPLKAELRMTAWGYNSDPWKDVVFYKWDITNKSSYNWDSTYFTIVNDPDVGDASDDYIGSDTLRNLSYAYNADNEDPEYGVAPPAIGTMFLRTPGNLGVTSNNFMVNYLAAPPPCETDPNGEPQGAYNFMKGFKKDLSPWLVPRTNPVQPTKYVYTGDPETNQGWNEANGSIQNCGGISGTLVNVNPPGERRHMMSTGSSTLIIQPNQKVTLVMAQLVAQDATNLRSVTKLKQYADQIKSFYETVDIKNISGVVPSTFDLYQNYPNPFNPVTTIKFNLPRAEFVKLRVFDITGREIATLVNQYMDLGAYKLEWNGSGFSSGVYFYKLETANFTDTKKMVLVK